MREEEEGYDLSSWKSVRNNRIGATCPLSVGLTVQLNSTKATKNFKFKCGKSSLGLNVY